MGFGAGDDGEDDDEEEEAGEGKGEPGVAGLGAAGVVAGQDDRY